MLYAHSKGEDQSDWQPLSKHLENVAELSAQFAATFGYEQAVPNLRKPVATIRAVTRYIGSCNIKTWKI